ncbi:hypothetical protein ES319_D06G245500v1 [Gossypium barbadense]|uniref:Uncharacterized protein n=2 Tax=Gossypium TaxID=3633 RepID=A0A5J5RDA6_GOSBA|nr:hypothetical protein ES319_D06G245500v1 [Gossypium barbadense]TYG66321.1 hypothetical protein ES288_D06G258500v1 [Gossypium darwinii]
MGSKVWLMFMPLALAMMTGCSTAAIFNKGHRYFRTGNRGLLVEKIDDIEAEMMMDSETDDGYISYTSLHEISIPCDQRGQSYYACQRGKPANPYNPGCSITHAYTVCYVRNSIR